MCSLFMVVFFLCDALHVKFSSSPPLFPSQDRVQGTADFVFEITVISMKNQFFLAKTSFSFSLSEGLEIPDLQKYLSVFSHFSVYLLSMFSWYCFYDLICMFQNYVQYAQYTVFSHEYNVHCVVYCTVLNCTSSKWGTSLHSVHCCLGLQSQVHQKEINCNFAI